MASESGRGSWSSKAACTRRLDTVTVTLLSCRESPRTTLFWLVQARTSVEMGGFCSLRNGRIDVESGEMEGNGIAQNGRESEHTIAQDGETSSRKRGMLLHIRGRNFQNSFLRKNGYRIEAVESEKREEHTAYDPVTRALFHHTHIPVLAGRHTLASTLYKFSPVPLSHEEGTCSFPLYTHTYPLRAHPYSHKAFPPSF